MKVSNRQRHILELLLSRSKDVTAGQLAQEVQSSTRTIHRELHELEPILLASGLSLVKKSGIGISVEGSHAELARFQDALRQADIMTYSSEERKVLILCRLLEEVEPVKLFLLASEVQAAIPTVSRDMDELEPQLAQNRLTLIRKRGYGVELEGSEIDKRTFIAKMSEWYLDPSDFFESLAGPSGFMPVMCRLLDLIGQSSFLIIEKSLWHQEEEWLKRLKEAEYTRLLVRVSVAIERLKRDHVIEVDTSPVENWPIDVADPTVFHLAETFGLELSEAEARYFRQLLDEVRASSVAHETSIMLDENGLALAEQTVELIRSIERQMNIPLGKDRSLFDGLLRHLGTAMERLRQGEIIRNPLLPQIIKDYEMLFSTLRSTIKVIWRDLVVPDEEVGYLVMHFGAAIERWKLAPTPVRALLVCTSGIGSSKLLAVRLTKEFPQIDLIGHYSWYEAARLAPKQYDAIISTVELPIESERYIKLSPLLTSEETEKLRVYMRTVALTKLEDTSVEAPVSEKGAWERLKLTEKYISSMVRVLRAFEVHEMNATTSSSDWKTELRKMVRRLEPSGAVLHEESVVVQLEQRELQGSVIIPDTELALFHTRTEEVSEIVLALFLLKSPLQLASGMKARQVFMMLAPMRLDDAALGVLSEISAMLLLPEIGDLFREGDADTIRAFFSKNLEIYIKSKLG